MHTLTGCWSLSRVGWVRTTASNCRAHTGPHVTASRNAPTLVVARVQGGENVPGRQHGLGVGVDYSEPFERVVAGSAPAKECSRLLVRRRKRVAVDDNLVRCLQAGARFLPDRREGWGEERPLLIHRRYDHGPSGPARSAACRVRPIGHVRCHCSIKGAPNPLCRWHRRRYATRTSRGDVPVGTRASS